MRKLNVGFLYVFILVLELIFVFIRKFSPEIYTLFDAIEKIIPVLLAPVAILAYKHCTSKVKIAVLLYLAYLLWGVIVSIINNATWSVIFYQLFHETKFLLICLPVFYFNFEFKYEETIRVLLKFIVIASIALVIFQVLLPSVYEIIFPNGGHHEKGFVFDMIVDRNVGIFWHPSQTGYFSLLLIITLFRSGLNEITDKPLMILSFLLLVSSIQRLEFFVLTLVLALMLVSNGNDRVKNTLCNVSVPILTLIVVSCLFFFSDYIYFASLELGSPRMIMYSESIFYLEQTLFLGAGWGTIGSHAAADLTSAYLYSDISDSWWWSEGRFLYDSFWPHVIGETGILGCVLLLSSLGTFVWALNLNGGKILFLAFIVTTFMSSNIQSIFFLVVLSFFILLMRSSDHKHFTEKPNYT